jgi:adenylate cyclase
MVLRSILCVPLIRKGELTGMIYADNRVHKDLFRPREQTLVQAFANQAAVAIENARLFESVRVSLEEITRARNLMDNVFASIASGVITTDGEERIVTFNEAAARILNTTLEPGQPLWNVLPPLYEGFDRLLYRVKLEKVEETVEAEPVVPGRGQISLNLRISPLKSSEGEIGEGVAIVLNDMTELKQRNAQLSTIRRYLPPAMVDNIQMIDRSQLGGEEREISILSCDVRGFTSFSEALQPEELMKIINQYLTVSSDAIHLGEGIIDKYMGDAVIGLFNTQLNPQENHAERAVRVGLMMARDVENLHESLEEHERLYYGIGIHTGNAILGNVGSPSRKEFTAIGDSIQYAKFLQENALGGQVLISQATYEQVQHLFTVESATPHRGASSYASAPIYRVTGLKRAR